MRIRRIENEWLLLEALQKANPGRIQSTRHGDSFAMEVFDLPALMEAPTDPADPGSAVKRSHSFHIVFPRYYPSMPLEVYLDKPAFHPNVHPDTGYVCLWTRHRVQTTLEHTLAQLRRILCWQLLNTEEEHVMQPAALLWYGREGVRENLRIESAPFVPIQAEAWMDDLKPIRRRLS
jgi:ubiquitin-protein ligase